MVEEQVMGVRARRVPPSSGITIFSRGATVELDFKKCIRFSHYRDILGVEVKR